MLFFNWKKSIFDLLTIFLEITSFDKFEVVGSFNPYSHSHAYILALLLDEGVVKQQEKENDHSVGD